MSISTNHADDGPRTRLAKLGSSSTTLLIGVVVFAAVVVVGVGLLTSSDAVTAELQAADQAASATSVADDGELEVSAEGEGDALLAALPRETQDIYLSRDPFEPVVEEPEDTEATPEGENDNPAEGDGDTDGDASTDPGREVEWTDAPRFEDGCTGSDEVVCGGRVVTLVGLFADRADPTAIIRVNSTVHEVTPGDEFAEYFTLRSIDDPCVSLTYGDEVFELCEGAHVMK